MAIQLHPYQQTALLKFTQSSQRSVLMVAPTGAGKGTMASYLMAMFSRRGKKVLFLVHRRELVHDMIERLRAWDIPVTTGEEKSNAVRVLSVQAALRMKIPPVDLLVIDEAHHYAADEWQSAMQRIKAKRIIGFTATPERSDGRPLGDMFEQIIEVVSYTKLLKQGVIVPCRVLRPDRRMLSEEIAQDPVDAYLRYAHGERTLIYVRRTKEADWVRDRLLQEGIRAGSVHSKMTLRERDATMLALEGGELDVVVNVGVLTEGVDVPHVTHLILARPCGHASTYLQIVGRALRSAEGKEQATLIDLVGASFQHGLPAEDRAYALEGEAIRRKSDSGPSGPSGKHRDEVEIENLDMELEEIPAMTAEEVLRWRARVVKRAWVAKKRAESPPEPKSGNRIAFTLHPTAPKQRPAPAPVTGGFVFQSNNFWNLGWYENGVNKRFGLGTRNEAEANEALELFREKGIEEVKEVVRKRKRRGIALVHNQNRRPFYMVFWDETCTERRKLSLYTEDRAVAEKIRSLWEQKRFDEAHAIIKRNQKESTKVTRRRRAESVKRVWAERTEASAP